jgi:hypothetical protein
MSRARQWLELALGLLLGLSLGLAVAWGIAPNARLDTSPAALRADHKDEYRLLVAYAYISTGDVGRAQTRLALLREGDAAQALLDEALRLRSGQAQSMFFPNDTEQSVYALALLANALQHIGAVPVIVPTVTASPVLSQPTATFAPFVLVSQETVCEADSPNGLVRIQVRDGAGLPLAGVEILVAWEGGQQRILTGLKSELGNGYADFIMSPGVLYSLRPVPSSAPITGLVAPDCTTEDGTEFQGGFLLIFEQP